MLLGCRPEELGCDSLMDLTMKYGVDLPFKNTEGNTVLDGSSGQMREGQNDPVSDGTAGNSSGGPDSCVGWEAIGWGDCGATRERAHLVHML